MNFLNYSKRISRVSLVGTCGNSRRSGFYFYDGKSCAEQAEQFSIFLIPFRSEIRTPLWKLLKHKLCVCVCEREREGKLQDALSESIQ